MKIKTEAANIPQERYAKSASIEVSTDLLQCKLYIYQPLNIGFRNKVILDHVFIYAVTL